MSDESDSWLKVLGITFEPFVEDQPAAQPQAMPDEPVGPALLQPEDEPADSVTTTTESAGADDSVATKALNLDVSALVAVALEALGGDADPDGPQPLDSTGKETLVMDPPIGVLQLIFAAAADAAGRIFNVEVVSSSKDVLLFAKVASGESVRSVKIIQARGTTTLTDVVINSFTNSGSGGGVTMQLQSLPPKKQPDKPKTPGQSARPSTPTLVMGDPIGSLPLLSDQATSGGRVFNVVVTASAGQAARIVAAASTGQVFATVTIFQRGITVTLRKVIISAASFSGTGNDINMTLDAEEPAEISPE